MKKVALSIYNFNSLSTTNKIHDLPFDLIIYSDKSISFERELILIPIDDQVNKFRKSLSIQAIGKNSDQLSLSLVHRNNDIAKFYLEELIKSFDEDGINDRQLEYSRTIEFVNEREKILKQDLGIIEFRKQKYKQQNNLSDITVDANNNINLKYKYDGEIFQLESQKQIAEYLVNQYQNQNLIICLVILV